jgi:protein-S-isoprenylcysteine O-methyltransferase Ste14
MNRMQTISILAFLWTVWCFLHSLLISRSFAAMMREIWGRRYAYYRATYSIFSLLTLIPVIYYQLSLEAKVVFAWPGYWKILQYGMYTAAFLLFYSGLRVYDIQYLLGIRQIHEVRGGSKTTTKAFTTEGILGYVRHPWYSSAILLVWAFGIITDVSLVSKIVLTTYIIIGTLLEEKKLICEIGEPYLAYRKRVPMFIPWKKA